MEKSRDAFRTISEVADLLDTPAHVLRFWESRFPQIRPVKRAGGRRYYRPSDVALLSGIKRLLHGDGLTIRGVQKVLRENGIRHVMALADGTIAQDALVDTLAEAEAEDRSEAEAQPVAEILAFPDPASGRGQPDSDSLPLWSTAPSARQEPALPAAADPARGSNDALPLPAGAPDIAPDPARVAKTVVPLQPVPEDDAADADVGSDDPGLAGVIAARLRALGGTDAARQRAAMVAAALRLRDLQARLAVAAGAGEP
jgi:DNA-binding transcriptional MerR regulator